MTPTLKPLTYRDRGCAVQYHYERGGVVSKKWLSRVGGGKEIEPSMSPPKYEEEESITGARELHNQGGVQWERTLCPESEQALTRRGRACAVSIAVSAKTCHGKLGGIRLRRVCLCAN